MTQDDIRWFVQEYDKWPVSDYERWSAIQIYLIKDNKEVIDDLINGNRGSLLEVAVKIMLLTDEEFVLWKLGR